MKNSKKIVLIADRVKDHNGTSIGSTNLEFVEDDYFNALYSALKSICPSVTYYDSPCAFLDNINLHKNDIVLSVWSGEKSRNRKSLVPSICEAYNIPYVGADSYLQIISADKHLSKKICDMFDICSAKDALISNVNDFWQLKELKFPIVIKPNLEGGSIGIFRDSVVDNIKSAIKVCENLLKYYSPIIAEEYLPGEEVSICIAGINKHIDVFQVMRQRIGNQTYFTHEILCAEVKKMHREPRYIESVNSILPINEKEKIINLYNFLGKVEVMRIDGRINDNRFYLIELTPDCSLNISGSISLAFKNSGFEYKEMLEILIQNAINLWEDQNSNM